MTTADEPLDLSLAAERTSLAWQRSGLGMMTVGGLLIHGRLGIPLLSELAGGLLVAAGALTTALVGPWRYLAIRAQVQAGRSPAARWVILLAAAVVGTPAGAAIGLALLH